MIWSDHSSIMDHGHLLLTISEICDPAFYYTSEELHGKNVQELVQKPHIYIMAKCRDTTEDQMLYSETRLEDINELKNQLCPPKRSPLRTYAGSFMDHPLQEVESGEQIGGGFGCCGCTGASASYIDHVMWFTEGTTHYPRIKKKKGTGRSSWKRKKKLWSARAKKS